MIWYILTISLFLGGIITNLIDFTGNLIYMDGTLFVFSGIFLVVSFFVTVFNIPTQKSDYISLKRKEADIQVALSKLKIMEKEYKEKEKTILNHEYEITKNLGFSFKDDIKGQGDNVLSHNLLAQLPELKAFENIKKFTQRIKDDRDRIFYKIEEYNQIIANILSRQENPLIYCPFIIKYNDLQYMDNIKWEFE